MEAQDLQAVVSSNSECNSNATVVMNTNVLPLFNLTSLSGDSDKTDFCPEKFGASLISGSEAGGVLQIVETSRGVVQVVTDSLNVGQLTLNGISNNQVTLSSLSNNTDLQQTALLTPGDAFTHHEGAASFEGQTETVADQTELHLASPMIISAPSQEVTASRGATVISVTTPLGYEAENKAPKRRGGWPKGKKRKKEKETHAPKAPVTAYVLFAMERRAAIKQSNPQVPFVEVTKVLGGEWSAMSLEAKQKYLDAAEADKKRYMDELKEYQHSEQYQNFLKRKKMKGLGSDEDSTGADGQYGDSNTILNELEEEGLYCKVCNQYFSSLHNRKEHMFGKQHLQALTNEFEKELQEEQDAESALNSEFSQDVLTTESDHALTGNTFPAQGPASSGPLDVSSFVEDFLAKNLEREQEIRELRRSLELAREQNAALVNKCSQLKELEAKLDQDLGNLKAYQAALVAQIDGLRMVPMLFGVINFYISSKDDES